MRYHFLLLFGLFFSSNAFGQNIYYIKTGPSFGFQQWRGTSNRTPLLGYHGVLGIESISLDKPVAFYAELGYHTRGSSERVRYVTGLGTREVAVIKNKFHNVALALGGKSKVGDSKRLFYSLAVRGEYTIDFEMFNYYRIYDQFVRRFNYGLDIGGGFVFPLGIAHEGLLQVTFSPDVSRQVYAPPLQYIEPETGYNRVFPEQKTFNYTFEFTLGFRLNSNPDLYKTQN